MIRIVGLTKRYPEGSIALRDIHLEVGRGEFVFITGPSGSGKTTLLRLLLRQEAPSEGQIFIHGYDLATVPRSRIPDLRRSMGIVFQDFKLIRRKSALENVAYVLNVQASRGEAQAGVLALKGSASIIVWGCSPRRSRRESSNGSRSHARSSPSRRSCSRTSPRETSTRTWPSRSCGSSGKSTRAGRRWSSPPMTAISSDACSAAP